MHRAQTRSGRPPRAPERFPTPGSQSMSAHGGPPPAVGTPVPAAATPRKLAGKCWRLVENQLQSTSGRCQLIDPHRRLPDSRHLGWRSLRALRGTKKKQRLLAVGKVVLQIGTTGGYKVVAGQGILTEAVGQKDSPSAPTIAACYPYGIQQQLTAAAAIGWSQPTPWQATGALRRGTLAGEGREKTRQWHMFHRHLSAGGRDVSVHLILCALTGSCTAQQRQTTVLVNM